ncbi:MAG: MFS transporter [Candidatus Binatia bacterium]
MQRAAWLANISGFANQLAVSMAHFLTPLYALGLGASPVVVGVIASASSVAGMIIALPAGKTIDRLGPKKALTYATVCKTLSMLIYLVISAPLTLVLPTFLIGVFGTVAILSFHSYVSGLSQGIRRAKGISDFAFFSSVGELAGPVVAGALVDLASFKAAFAYTALICIITLLALWYLPAISESGRAEEKPTPLRGFRGLLTHRGVQSVLMGSSSFALLRSFLRAFLPVLLYNAFSATEIGSLFFVTTVASLLGRSAVRWTIKLWPMEKALPICVLLNALPLILMPGATWGYVPLAALMALFGISNGFLGVVTAVQTADTVAAQERGLAFGIRTTSMRFGSVIGQLGFGTIAELTSVSLSFFGAGFVGVVCAMLLPKFMRRK